MAKSKTITEELLALLPPEQAAAFRKTLEANPGLAVRAAKETELYDLYMGNDDDDPASAAAAASAAASPAVHTPTLPSAAAAPTAGAAGGNDEIKELIKGLQTSLDAKVADLKKDFVPRSMVDQYVATAVKVSDNYAQVREDHRAEFGETLSRTDFEKFIAAHPKGTWLDDAPGTENGKTGMKKAHDSFVADKRTQKLIKDGVAAGVKQELSARTVPGQTQSVALSPALQAMAKARETAGGGTKSNAMAAAERLAAMVRAREEGGQTIQ